MFFFDRLLFNGVKRSSCYCLSIFICLIDNVHLSEYVVAEVLILRTQCFQEEEYSLDLRSHTFGIEKKLLCMNFSDLSSESLSTPTFRSREGHVSSLELYICSGSLWLEVVLDCFEK